MHPVLLTIGPVNVYSFGVLMGLALYVAGLATVSEYERRGGEADSMWKLVIWIFLGGLLGARLLFFLDNPSTLSADPIHEILSGAGFVWYGGLIGGVAAAALLARSTNVRFSVLLECAAPGLAIGQAIGRIGCHMAGDGDWGLVTTLPWGVAYRNAIVGWNYAPGVLVHPTPLYEALAYTAIFVGLWRLRKRNLPEGTLFSLYLLGTSLTRFSVEFIRINPRVAFGLTQPQIIAVALFFGSALWLVRHPPFASSLKAVLRVT